MQTYTATTDTLDETIALGEIIGQRLRGGEILEFSSDLGGGKTSFVRGLAKGFGSPDPVASPSFTISYVYSRPDGKQLHHFDFYRLQDAGIVASELAEVAGDPDSVIALEWGELVHNVLPEEKLVITIKNISDNSRLFTFTFPASYDYLFQNMQTPKEAA